MQARARQQCHRVYVIKDARSFLRRIDALVRARNNAKRQQCRKSVPVSRRTQGCRQNRDVLKFWAQKQLENAWPIKCIDSSST